VTKLLTAAAAAFFAVAALFGSGAEAGFNMRLKAPAGFSTLEKAGCGGGYRRVYRKRYQSARRRVKRKVQVASKPVAEKVAVAKVEPETKVETTDQVVQSENSSISTANGKVAEAKPVEAAKPEEKKVAAAKEVGCKQFFPSVGMTLSVSCK
jgi:hypothetical protein